MSEQANIRDVAARADVAVKTVSRVLNGHRYVISSIAGTGGSAS